MLITWSLILVSCFSSYYEKLEFFYLKKKFCRNCLRSYGTIFSISIISNKYRCVYCDFSYRILDYPIDMIYFQAYCHTFNIIWLTDRRLSQQWQWVRCKKQTIELDGVAKYIMITSQWNKKINKIQNAIYFVYYIHSYE